MPKRGRTKKIIGVYDGPRAGGAYVAEKFDQAKIPYEYLDQGPLIENDLDRFSALIFPGGHSISNTPEMNKHVKQFVKKGGGFIGICAGLHYGLSLKFLKLGMMYVRGRGEYQIRIIRKHPIGAGYGVVPESGVPGKRKPPTSYSTRGRVHILRVNGGLMINQGKPNPLVATYDDTDKYGAVAAGTCGKGRVALFSAHPECSDPPNQPEQQGKDATRLLYNAAAWVSRQRFRMK